MAYRSLRLNVTWRPAGHHVPDHTHDGTCLAFCLRGPFEETVGARWHTVDPESVILRPGGLAHSNRYPGRHPARAVVLELAPRLVNDLRAETRALDQPRYHRSPLFSLWAHRFERESRVRDSAGNLAIEAMVYDVLASIARAKETSRRTDPGWLRAAEGFLRAEFLKATTLTQVSAAVGVHPSHVARIFRRRHGMTVGEFVRRLRVERSLELLRAGQLPVASVAAECGFHDQSHFTRVFKQHCRMTPGQYAAIAARDGRRKREPAAAR